jgi:hypothetical protein
MSMKLGSLASGGGRILETQETSPFRTSHDLEV